MTTREIVATHLVDVAENFHHAGVRDQPAGQDLPVGQGMEVSPDQQAKRGVRQNPRTVQFRGGHRLKDRKEVNVSNVPMENSVPAVHVSKVEAAVRIVGMQEVPGIRSFLAQGVAVGVKIALMERVQDTESSLGQEVEAGLLQRVRDTESFQAQGVEGVVRAGQIHEGVDLRSSRHATTGEVVNKRVLIHRVRALLASLIKNRFGRRKTAHLSNQGLKNKENAK